MFRQLSVVVVFSLLMSLFVAVTLVPVLCSQAAGAAAAGRTAHGLGGRLYTFSERVLEGMDDGYRASAPPGARASADGRRRRRRVGRRGGADPADACRPSSRPQTDEGRCSVNVELAHRHAHRAAPTRSWQRLEQMIHAARARSADADRQAAAAAAAGGSGPAAAASTAATCSCC